MRLIGAPLFIAMTLLLLAGPFAPSAQQPALPVIGFLNTQSPGLFAHLLAGFHQGLSEAGYVEGRNVSIVKQMMAGGVGTPHWSAQPVALSGRSASNASARVRCSGRFGDFGLTRSSQLPELPARASRPVAERELMNMIGSVYAGVETAPPCCRTTQSNG